jgi:hypothetical protein
MNPLNPAIEVELPAEGWRRIAVDGGRYSSGLQASADLWNGRVKDTDVLHLARPEQWGPLKAVVAATAGCAEGHVHETILSLKAAIEGQLRDQAAPAGEHSGACLASHPVGGIDGRCRAVPYAGGRGLVDH